MDQLFDSSYSGAHMMQARISVSTVYFKHTMDRLFDSSYSGAHMMQARISVLQTVYFKHTKTLTYNNLLTYHYHMHMQLEM